MAEYAQLSIDALRRHLKLKPDDGQAWMTLARALLETSPGPELSHAIGQSLRCLPDSQQASTLADAAQQRARGAEAALQWLEDASARNPYRPAPHLALARLRLSRLQLVEALAAVTRAIGIAGETAEALSVRGEVNLQGAHWQEALADFRQVQKAAVNDAQLMHVIGRCYFGLGDYQAAEAPIRKALARDPRQLESRFALALSCLVQDITERRENQLQLQHSQALLNSVFDHLPNMVFVKDARTLRFVEFNKAGERLTGFSREELLGKSDYDFFPREEA